MRVVNFILFNVILKLNTLLWEPGAVMVFSFRLLGMTTDHEKATVIVHRNFLVLQPWWWNKHNIAITSSIGGRCGCWISLLHREMAVIRLSWPCQLSSYTLYRGLQSIEGRRFAEWERDTACVNHHHDDMGHLADVVSFESPMLLE